MNKRNKSLLNWFDANFQQKIKGRHITLSEIFPLIENLEDVFKVSKIGESFQQRGIYKVRFGNGKIPILIWTQMHGNESTGTKALFDLMEFIKNPGKLVEMRDAMLHHLDITCIPMLNPDGALAYTRVNAQNIDLNRDVVDKKAIESQLLQDVLKEVNPVYCFNMHDQRTIFSVTNKNNPATISFLAPSEDKERTITKGRLKTMQVVQAMDKLLRNVIPNQIGRYTDEFYPTATGDNFQKMGHNTILIESGHYKGDYKREVSRKFTFLALLEGLYFISKNNKSKKLTSEAYFEIPENEKKYTDVLLKNVKLNNNLVDVDLLFKEELVDGNLHFNLFINRMEANLEVNADKIVDMNFQEFENKLELEKFIKNEFY